MKRSRILSLLSVVLLSAMLLPAPSVAAGKPAAKGAKPAAKAAAKPAAKPASSSSSSSASKTSASSTPYEVPSPAPSDAPATTATTSAPATPAAPVAETASKPAEPAKTEAPKEPAPTTSSSEPTSIPEPPAPVVEEPLPPAEPLPVYVEHLGPSSYPGRLRGIYGGSMWLEPSFHGLQWPHMAKSGVGVSGSFWVDTGWEKIKRDATPPMADTAMYLQQGRAVLRVTPTYTDGRFFIQGQVELVGNVCQASSQVCITSGTVDTDDLWIRVGQWNAWDLKVGRFEGWELYHTGMGLDINTQERLGAHNLGFNAPGGLRPPDYYGTNWMQYRPTEGLGVGYLAFHAYPTETIRFELLGELGAADATSQGYTYLGGRPSLIFDQGWVKVKLGAEYEKRTGDSSFITDTGVKQDSKAWRTRKGLGGAVQFVIDPRAEFGGNFSLGSQENHDNFNTGDLNTTDSFSRNSVGGFANVRLASLWLLGGGANYTWQNDKYYYQNAPSPNWTAHMQTFGAIQYLLARQLYIKAVIGYSRADFVTSDPSIPMWSNYMYSGRVRLMYLY